jgi:hypothetical protein
MIGPHYLNATRKICLRLKDCRSAWAVTGSLGMALQGMDLEIHDIDLQTDQRGAFEIEGLLREYVVKPVEYLASSQIRSYLGALEIDGVKIEIMGALQKLVGEQAWEDPVPVEQHRLWVDLEGMQVPVLSLVYEYEAYRKLGRFEKAEKIKRWLEGEAGR